MKKSDSLIFELSKKSIVWIYVYYFVILLVGGIVSISILCRIGDETNQNSLMIRTVISSLAVGGMMCSLQYIKRLYKACITDRIIEKATYAGNIGNIAYFLFRPLYAFAFIIVMIYAVLSGMFIVTGSLDYVINNKFLYLCVICSSVIGYSVGHLLDKFDLITKEKIEEIHKNKGGTL